MISAWALNFGEKADITCITAEDLSTRRNLLPISRSPDAQEENFCFKREKTLLAEISIYFIFQRKAMGEPLAHMLIFVHFCRSHRNVNFSFHVLFTTNHKCISYQTHLTLKTLWHQKQDL